MIQVRQGASRGRTLVDWLESYHSFSFGEYHDPQHMGFRALRVINDDVIAPGGGFGMHGHRDMEIVTYMLSGALAHRDSLGNGDVMHADDVQAMTAGSGIRHSESNASPDEPVHLLQIWLYPDVAGRQPRYQQRNIPRAEREGRLRLIASPDERDDALHIHQDVRIYATVLKQGDKLQHALAPGRHAWIQVARGEVSVNSEHLAAGDGAALVDETLLRFESEAESELLLFDLA